MSFATESRRFRTSQSGSSIEGTASLQMSRSSSRALQAGIRRPATGFQWGGEGQRRERLCSSFFGRGGVYPMAAPLILRYSRAVKLRSLDHAQLISQLKHLLAE